MEGEKEELSPEYSSALAAMNELLANKNIKNLSLLQSVNKEILKLNESNIPTRTSKQCNVTWTSGCIAYKCRDCQFDSTCVVCVDCFRKADHTGHDYSITKTGGGCCDCGDAEAWDSKGFCSDHSISTEQPHPSEILNKELSQRIFGAVQAACEFLRESNSYSFQSRAEKKTQNSKCIMIIHWMDELCSLLGDAAKWIIGRVFSSSFYVSESIESEDQTSDRKRDHNLLLSLFLQDETLSPEVREELHKLYFTLLGEPEFKEQFARNFIKFYLFQLHGMGTGARKELLAFSVQLFSTPSLVPLFIESGFLNQLFNRLEELFQRIMIREESGAVRLKWMNGILRKNFYLPLFYDLRYLISLKDISRHILFTDTKNMLSSFLQLFVDLNDGQVHQRVPSTRNCLDDDDTWSICWSLEDHLISLATKLSKGFEIIEGHAIHTRSNCIEKLRMMLEQIIESMKKLNRTRKVKTENERFKQVKFQVSRDKVSLSAPLFKLVEIFLDRAINKLQIPLNEIIRGIENEFLAYIVESPLRLQVLYAQVAAKMWIRNGLRFQWVVQMQQYSVRYFTHVPKDIFLLQCCAASMTPERLFILLQDRFEMDSALYFHPKDSNCNPEWDTSQITVIVERFLSTIAVIVTNRTMVGIMSTEKKIREFVKHSLFLKPSTHSELMNNILNQYTKHPKLKQIISEVADFDTTPMQSGEPGRYLIKPEMWDTLDPYFIHFSPTELQEAQERYFAHQRKENSSYTSKIIPVPVPAFNSLSQSFRGLLDILQSRHLHRILYWSLLYAAESETIQNDKFKWKRIINLNQEESGVYSSITTIHHSLRLLFLACSTRTKSLESELPAAQNFPEFFSSPCDLPFQYDDIAANIIQQFNIPSFKTTPNDTPMSYSLLQILVKIYESQPPLHDYIGSIFDILGTIDTKLSLKIETMLHKEETESEDSEDRAKEMRAKQAAKQKEIMESFKRRQETFMRESAELFEGDEDMFDDDYPVCAVCKDSCLPTLDKPVGRVAYEQRTRLIQLHSAQNYGAAITEIPLSAASVLRSDHFRFFDALRNVSRAQEAPAQPNEEAIDEENPEEQEKQKNNKEIPPIVWEEMLRPKSSLDIQFCQHVMHIECFQTYYDTLIKQAQRQFNFALDIQANEFHCPICRALSNIIVPLPPTELLELVEPTPQEQSEEEKLLDSSSLKLFAPTKNVYDTFTMNCSLVYDLKALKYYIPFHIANDILYISAIRSKIESIELVTRNELVPPVSILAENRPMIQQLYNSALGYKKCCQIDEVNYSCAAMIRHVKCLRWIVFGEETCEFLYGTENLLSCDIFAVLVSLVFYSPQRIELESFDRLVQVLFAAHILQILLSESNSKCEPSAKVFAFTSHPHLDEVVFLVSSVSGIQSSPDNNTRLFDEGFEFLRKVYILRHTVFDVFFSSLPSESSSVPFSDLCDVLICEPRKVVDLPKYLDHWMKLEGKKKENVKANASFAPFKIIDLPAEYSFAYDKKYTSLVCEECQERPKKPALCLLCGKLVCAATKCCARDGFGECNRHTRSCGGVGVYLLLNSTMVLLLQNGKGCLWDSLYVDEHGEVDEDLLRGKELYLSKIKLKELSSICVNQRIVMACVKKNENSRSLVFWENY